MKTEKKCQLYFLGVGPGDPELLTLKTVRLIQNTETLFVPVRTKDATDSLALEIVKKEIDLRNKRIVYLHFPMVKGAKNMLKSLQPAVEIIEKELSLSHKGCFITLGCSTIYSTAGNLYVLLKEKEISMRFIPGVSAISATAAACGSPLVLSEEKLAILPVTYSVDQIEWYIDHFDVVVLMKVHSNLEIIRHIIEKKKLIHKSFIVERASFDEEIVTCLHALESGYKPNYMSTLLINKT